MKKSGIGESDTVSQVEIKKNSQGIYYLDMKITGKAAIVYLGFFYTKIDKVIYTTYTSYSIVKENPELEKKYYQLIDTMNLTGTLPYKSATV